MSNSEPSTIETVVREIALALEPLGRAAEAGPEGFIELAYAAGIDIEAQLEAVEDLDTVLNAIEPAFETLETVIETREIPDEVDQAIKDAVAAVKDLATLSFVPTADLAPEEVVDRLLDHLIIRYFRFHHPSAFSVLEIIDVIDTTTPDGEPPRVNFEALDKFLDPPEELLEHAFEWGSEALDWQEVLQWLRRLLLGAGIHSRLEPPVGAELEQIGIDVPTTEEIDTETFNSVVPPIQLTIPLLDTGDRTDHIEAGLKVVPLPSINGAQVGFVVAAYGVSKLTEKVEIDEAWTLQFDASATAAGGFGVLIRPQDVEATALDGEDDSADMWATATISHDSEPDERILLLGWPGGPRIEVSNVGLQLRFEASPQGTDFTVESPLDWHIQLDPPIDDGFLQSFLPEEGVTTNVSTNIGVSSEHGLQLGGSAGMEVDIVSHERFGPVHIDEVMLRLGISDTGQVTATVSGTIGGKLGPLSVVIGGLGYQTTIAFVGEGGSLGPVDLDGEVIPPSRIGLSIDTGAIVGGGYLDFDSENNRYAGILELVIAEKISVTAIGLLTTELPDGSDGFSLLIVLTGEFPPVQLGFGLTLNGLGGLLGVNRTANVPSLQEGVKTGRMKHILFPEDPIQNANQLISNLRTAFPPQADRFLIGPLARLGWGSPRLITADIAVILELPSPIRLLLLGRLTATFPDEEAKLLNLNMDVLGVIDFAEKRAAIDASLYDSRLVTYILEGDMAMRANWGDDPGFLLSVGGFNPRYLPPPNLPALKRVSVSLTSSDNPRLRMEGYFAVTSNTVQVGAHLDVYAGAGGFSVSGELKFDTLFEFDPFRFITDLFAKVALKGGPFEISVDLDMTLSGPSPFRAKGIAHYEFLFIDGSVRFDTTFGSEPAAQPLPPVEVLPQLLEAFSRPSNWAAQLPATSGAAVRLREVEYSDSVAVHPLGTITVRQQTVPLSTRIDKVGGTRPADGRRFEIQSVESLQEDESGNEDDLKTVVLPFDANAVEAQFAPDQYLDLTGEERLTEPGFRRYPAGAQIGASGIDFPGAKDSAYSSVGVTTAQTATYEQQVIDKRVSRTRRKAVNPTVVGLPSTRAVALAPMSAAGRGIRPAQVRTSFLGPQKQVTIVDPKYVLASSKTFDVETAFVTSDHNVVGVRLDTAKERLKMDAVEDDYRVVEAYEVTQ